MPHRFVDHHVHLLRVAAGVRPPYAPFTAEAIAAYHRSVARRRSTPMDEPPEDPSGLGADDLPTALRDGLQRAADLGLVGITEAGMSDWRHWDALVELRSRDELPVDVRVLIASGAFAADAGRVRDAVDADDSRLAVAGVKLYADGWLGPRTCACSMPFADVHPADAGVLFLERDELARRVDAVASAGLRAATHTIGDRAIETALDAYELAYGNPAEVRRARPRLEHVQVLRADLVDRIVELGVVCCIQPCFAASDAESIRLALAGRYPEAYRWDLLVEAGASVIAGSDFPIETLDPAVGFERLTTGDHPLDEDVVRRVMTVPLDAA